MVSVATVTALALKLPASVLLAWVTVRTYRSRERPSAEPFLLLSATLTLWAGLSLGATVPGVAGVSLVESVLDLTRLGAVLVLPVAWTIYALSYAGHGAGLTRRRLALLSGMAVPVVVSGVAIAGGDPESTAVEGTIAFSLVWALLYGTVLFLYGTYLLVGLGRKQSRVSNVQVAALTGGVAAPNLLSLAGDGVPPVGGTTLGLLVSGIVLAAAVQRYPVMTGFPKADYVARSRVVETLQEALFVLDWDDHVIDVNETATETFDAPAEGTIGDPIRSVVDGLDGTDLAAGTTGTVALRTSSGRRQFQYSVSTVDEGAPDDTDPVARTVLFRDITDRETREQRLTVLNRVLRHNVRNELDVVLAYADRIDDQEVRDQIRERTTTLLELSETVRDTETVMAERADAPEPVDVAEVTSAVVDRHRSETDAADISLVCPDEAVVSAHRAVLRRALSELVENALEHTPGTPHVEVEVRDSSDDEVTIIVADDGPGLPERPISLLVSPPVTSSGAGRIR